MIGQEFKLPAGSTWYCSSLMGPVGQGDSSKVLLDISNMDGAHDLSSF